MARNGKEQTVETPKFTAAPSPEPSAKAQPVVKYQLDTLRANCRTLFKVTTSEFDGATYGLDGEFTKDEMSAIIEKWRKTPLKKKEDK